MGWTGIHHETGTHAQIDRELMHSWTNDRGDVMTATDCKLVGFRHHYHIHRVNGVAKAIIVTLIERYRESKDRPQEWLYKDMDEDMHPYFYDCPLELLEKCPPTGSDASNEWRAGVREHHARRAGTKGLAVGDYFTTSMYEGQELQVLRFQRRTPVYRSPKDGSLYTMPRTRITGVRKADFV